MKYSNTIKLAAISFIASSFLVGCGDNSTVTTATPTATTVKTFSGVASDPELQGANVYLDINEDGIYQESELNTTTDDLGNYTLDVPQEYIGKPIVVEGGVDRVTKEDFTGQLSIITSSEEVEHHITPLTTLVHKYKVENPDMSIEDVETELTQKLGLSSVDELHEDTTKEGNEHLLDVALHLEKVAELIQSDDASVDNSAEVYTHIATELKKDENLSDAIEHTITNNESLDALSQAKALDLHKELSELDTDSMSKDALALSVENIDDSVANAQDTTELEKELCTDETMLVHEEEVQDEQEHRLLTTLGLENLSAEEQQAILDKVDVKSVNHKEIDLNKLELDDTTKLNAQKDMIFHELKLNKLNVSTLEALNVRFLLDGFDFSTATVETTYAKIQEDGFLGDDATFAQTILDTVQLKTEEHEEDK